MRGLHHPVWKAIGAILAALAALATVVAIAVQLSSNSSSSSSASSCSKEGAALSKPLVQPSTVREYLERTNASTERLNAKRLATPISEVSVSVSIDGYKKRQLTLKWSMLDASSKKAIGKRDRPVIVIQPSACETRMRQMFPVPAGPRRVIADIVLEDDQPEGGNVLDEVRTPPFLASAL